MTYKELEAAYLEAVVGEKPPTAGIILGAILNSLVGYPRYDPMKRYLVTETSITKLEDQACG